MVAESLAWFIGGLAVVGPAIVFVVFLRFFRSTRLVFKKNLMCPEKRSRATVEFVTRLGDEGPYRDVESCSVAEKHSEISCQKRCLPAATVLNALFSAIRKQRTYPKVDRR